MKKINFLLMLVACLLAFQQYSVAQKQEVTSKTATKSKGYTIVNAGESITIYKYKHQAHSPKEIDKYSPRYFFITQASDVLQPLTKMKLKAAFPDNHPFHDAMDATFKSDEELAAYDEFHKMYKVNWLLKQHP